MKTRTVRELGGEIWAEISSRLLEKDETFQGLDRVLNPTIDLIMGVLARYEGIVISNDTDIPVTPLPYKKHTENK